ncbi:MAG: chromosome partitioning protein ParB [Candidatus Infernicultor aquiphilus]|uniref:Chromosome partitioning protein ParB n=1 Tax=Candidatus Infernicultor aquiphilus TaxID=1805029 RepID=A0A1J5GNA8_9BACT|nr:ParB/RepB/Spo0J family partition protein [bacterium]OIP69342.1 MAG: chromosome partitioning protein ParB [Candidatus Atribacteria bacterium CG2_30_33_13]PIU25605.1 MAG: chromosome partitioning protein ParB [Candidatus Atribacteria bacterium CG08_land_8_20_14_0_20_33_29]PIW11358.1 MAG: chromosome partitioning protein ParB [Candidatus Atribacteria bacterium CG17_big_fil_post_rev_8_21_14_2_50_34_11]PIX34807.1 MAG: chromosome partitioning protein ParB [Candidatus Atribacteria bacterium CG_4_8_14
MVKRGLGKGLEALIPKIDHQENEFITEIEIESLTSNLFQPRKNFDQEKLEELKESIKRHGVIQPIVVRKIANGYEIVAGERRLRAAQEIKLKKIPAIIKNFSNEKSLEIALAENIQREDLNPIEQANAFKRLIDEFKLTQQELAEVTGKSRALVTNTIRLLKLNSEIQKNISEGKISFGHAKLLLSLEDEELQRVVCNRIMGNDLSVRDTENLIKKIGKAPKKPFIVKNITLENFPEAEEKLRDILGTKISILYDGKKGKINIEFYSKEDLRRIVDLLLKGK